MSPISPSPRRKRRRLLAGVLALLGVGALALALTGDDGGPGVTPAKTAGSLTGALEGTETTVPGAAPGATTGATGGKAPTDGPGGVGSEPEKTGLPAKPAQGGLVRTGTVEEGCFPDLRSYLDAWDKTGKEPDPCFTAQPASEQKQPPNVQRTYNGERF